MHSSSTASSFIDMLPLIGLQKSITHPWPRIATCNACRFGKGIGESIHVILVCLDPIIFPCCVCKENTRAPSNTPVVAVLGAADPRDVIRQHVRLSVPVAKAVQIFQSDLRHRPRPLRAAHHSVKVVSTN